MKEGPQKEVQRVEEWMYVGRKKYSYHSPPHLSGKLLDLGMVIKANTKDVLGKQPVVGALTI